jgi:hypothetical protein
MMPSEQGTSQQRQCAERVLAEERAVACCCDQFGGEAGAFASGSDQATEGVLWRARVQSQQLVYLSIQGLASGLGRLE